MASDRVVAKLSVIWGIEMPPIYNEVKKCQKQVHLIWVGFSLLCFPKKVHIPLQNWAASLQYLSIRAHCQSLFNNRSV